MFYTKYIIYDDPPIPFLFPENILHSQFVNLFNLKKEKIKSAGYCELLPMNMYYIHLIITKGNDLDNVDGKDEDKYIIFDTFTKKNPLFQIIKK